MTIVFVLAAILIFGVLIAVHEFGHFAAAKLSGVQVNEFSIGMGPLLWSRTRGETQYSLRLIPIGGYCAMEGEEETSENPRALRNQGFWKRFFIFFAGPLMNFLTGFAILLVLYGGAALLPTAQIAGTAPEFAANNGAVLEEGDQFYAINGERVYVASDVELLLDLYKGRPLDLVVLRDGKRVALDGLIWGTYSGQDGTPYTGYGIYSIKTYGEATAIDRIQEAWRETLDFARIVRLSLQMLVSGEAGLDDVGGPVVIVSTITEIGQAAETASQAVNNILSFAALIAVNLAVMNLLPIPALDGGHIVFLILDTLAMKTIHKKIPDRYEAAISGVFLVALMCFMLVVTVHDVYSLLQ